uniref:BTB domain-containing protein n=3 Tax=Timema TaxID=61471 RepID=A0A7R9GTN4_TIMPO|nr:unnamed protein product [Timema poppensis]
MHWPSRLPGLNSFCSPVAPGTKTFVQLMTLLETHYAPPRSVYEERSTFNYRKQSAGASYLAFSLSLRHLAATCSFGTFLNDALKSQFYHNISSDMIRDKIRNEEGNFSAMVALASHYHIPGPATAPTNVSDNPNLINAVRPYKHKNNKFKKKFQSSQGKNLSSRQDPISRLKARYVQVVVGLMLGLIVLSKMRNVITVILEGHIAKVCRRVKSSSQHQGGVRQIQEDIPSVSVQANTACDLYVVNSSQAPARSSVQLEVYGVPLTMEVDTAASASLIGEPVYIAHFKHLPLFIPNMSTLLRPLYALLKQDANCRVIVPSALCPEVLELLHELHPGSSRMKNLARGFVWCALSIIANSRRFQVKFSIVSTVSYLVMVGGRSKQISTSHLRLRDLKGVPVELSWEMVEQATPAPMTTPTSDGPTPGPLIQPSPVADRSRPASPAPEPSTDSTPETLRRASQCDGSGYHPCVTCCSASEIVCPPSNLIKLIAWGCPSNNSLWTSGHQTPMPGLYLCFALMAVQQFCLRWNNHQPNFVSVFTSLLNNESLVDVTLAAEGRHLQAHRVVLSACSTYFQTLFTVNPCQHPIVILKDVKYNDLKTMVDFMYYGEVNVSQEQLPAILKASLF